MMPVYLLGAWVLTCYWPSMSALWCQLGLLAPAGQPHLFSLPWAYPAVGWTTGTLLVDLGVIVCLGVGAHAFGQVSSQVITTEEGKKRTEWTVPGRRMASVYVIAAGVALLGMGLGVGMQLGWGRTAAVPLCVAGVGLLASRTRQHEPVDEAATKGDVTAVGAEHKAVRRLHQLLKNRRGEVVATLVPGSMAYGSDGSPLAYKVKAVTVGYFSTAEGRGTLDRLCAEMPGDEWDFTLQTGDDVAEFERPEKKNFPKFAVPHPDMFWQVQSVDEAMARYPDFKIPLGVDESGQPVGFSLKDFPHMALVGESGSGKTITLSSVVESFLSGGWEVAIGDGKMVDYGPLRKKVIMVTTSDEEYARLIYWAWEEMQGRKSEMQYRLDNGIPGSGDFPPLLVLLDEFAAVYLRLMDRFPKEFDSIMSKISQLQKEGRQLRVHVIFATQTFRNEEFPRKILDACQLKVSLGPPNNITIKQAFQGPVRDRAEYLGGKMKDSKGRALVTIADAPPERSLLEYQSWIGYSPATPDTAFKLFPEKVRKQHRYLKKYISGKAPKLYSRQWFKIDSIEDWEKSFEEICEIPSVSLDLEDGTPDPAAYCYDPGHRKYNGKDRSGKRWGAQVKILRRKKNPSSSEATAA